MRLASRTASARAVAAARASSPARQWETSGDLGIAEGLAGVDAEVDAAQEGVDLRRALDCHLLPRGDQDPQRSTDPLVLAGDAQLVLFEREGGCGDRSRVQRV